MLGHENQFTKLILTYTEVISEAESSFLQKFYVMSFTTNWISFAPKYVYTAMQFFFYVGKKTYHK